MSEQKIKIENVEKPATFKQAGMLKFLYERKYGQLKPNVLTPFFKSNYKGYPDVNTISIEDASRLIEEWNETVVVSNEAGNVSVEVETKNVAVQEADILWS